MLSKWQSGIVWLIVCAATGDWLSATELPGAVAPQASPVQRATLPTPSPRDREPARPSAVKAEASPVVPPAPQGVAWHAPLPALPPPKAARKERPTGGTAAGRPVWIAGRLGWVLAAFCGLMLVQRWLGPRAGGSLPAGMVQVCGKVPLDAKQSLHLVRIGQRLLVLLESPRGMQRLAEITDPSEVRRLLQPHSPATQGFNSYPAATKI
jgi:flagellar biogenesis protein FliO